MNISVTFSIFSVMRPPPLVAKHFHQSKIPRPATGPRIHVLSTDLVILEVSYIRERGSRGADIKVIEKRQLLASCTRSNQDRTLNVGVCPDQEWNWQPWSTWEDAQPAKPPQLGLSVIFIGVIWANWWHGEISNAPGNNSSVASFIHLELRRWHRESAWRWERAG